LNNSDLLDVYHNAGVSSIREARKISPLDEDPDPVWHSSSILDQLERFTEGSRKTKSQQPFDAISPVLWLDALTKERCEEELVNVSAFHDEVSFV
jgi:hypothetical protein